MEIKTTMATCPNGHHYDAAKHASCPFCGAVPAVSERIAIEKLHEQGCRKSQQDSFFVSPEEEAPTRELIEQGPGLLAVVGDGMGGLSNGDQVS